MLLNNKKGSVELKVIIFSLIFMTILNIMLGQILDPSLVTDYNQDQAINEIVSELGAVSGFITSALLNIAIAIYSIFGVDFILAITVLPTIVVTLLTLFNAIVTFSIVFYLVDRIWIG